MLLGERGRSFWSGWETEALRDVSIDTLAPFRNRAYATAAACGSSN